MQIFLMPTANDKRIARNTAYLYGRMLLTMFVSLYTSRVVLDVLGVSDYGIYNVVGGIVIILNFLNGTMSGATSRFLSFELGKGDDVALRKIFSAAITVHALLAIILLILAETVGLWYVNTNLVIAPERMAAANWTYQFSVLAAVLTVMQMPFVGSIMAHEAMGYYAVVAIVNVLLKLAVVLALLFLPTADNLIAYAALILVASAVVAFMYMAYCRRHYAECRWSLHNDKTSVRRLLSFCSWDVFGNLCFTMRAQGMLVVLNRFGGTVLNAAGGLCATVSSVVGGFAGSIITAFRPQIIQQYARADYRYMLQLLDNCARYSLLLLGLMVTPMILCIDTLLGIWLVDIPPYTAVFCRLALIAVYGELLNTVLAVGIHATGRVARISFISGSLYLLELPMMWLLLKWSENPPVIYCVHIVMVFVIVYVNSLILNVQLPSFGMCRFWWRGVAVPMAINLICFAVTFFLTPRGGNGLLILVECTALSAVLLGALSWMFAIDGEMRRLIIEKVRQKFHKSI